MEGANNGGIKNLSLGTALNVISFCCVSTWKRKAVFAFNSLVQVKFIPELYTWKRKGWKDSSCGNTSDVFPSLHRGCNSSCFKKKGFCLSQHQAGTLFSQESLTWKEEKHFLNTKSLFHPFWNIPLPPDPPVFVLVPKGMKVAGQIINSATKLNYTPNRN